MEEILPLIGVMTAANAEAVVREVMHREVWSIAAVADDSDYTPFSNPSLDRFFTEAFRESYRAVMGLQESLDIPLLDGDPIVASQEYCPLWDLNIGPATADGGYAMVTVTFKSYWCYPEAGALSQEETEVVFDLVFVGKSWQIDDFATDGQSFRALLETLYSEGILAPAIGGQPGFLMPPPGIVDTPGSNPVLTIPPMTVPPATPEPLPGLPVLEAPC